jgi:hypothetical protein
MFFPFFSKILAKIETNGGDIDFWRVNVGKIGNVRRTALFVAPVGTAFGMIVIWIETVNLNPRITDYLDRTRKKFFPFDMNNFGFDFHVVRFYTINKPPRMGWFNEFICLPEVQTSGTKKAPAGAFL